ncbi:MAG TPA: glycine cleavage system protein T, partial [Desulfuromonadales bacterium]|nr:glycine cleavage system protein T [Desulfuromonadales bacterium]
PLEAGLEGFVNFEKKFIGRDALLKQREQGVTRRKIAFRTANRRAPRHDYEICSGADRIGTATSGVFSPMIGCGVGIGFVNPELSVLGTVLEIRHERISMEATVCELPFYRDGSLRA